MIDDGDISATEELTKERLKEVLIKVQKETTDILDEDKIARTMRH